MATRVLPWLYLGSRADARDRDALRLRHITTIINMTPTRVVDPVAGVSNYFEADASLKYLRFPMYDSTSQKLTAVLLQALTAIDRQQHYGSVLVHCAKGVSRSAAIVLGYLIKTFDCDADSGLAFLRTLRPEVDPNAAFMEELRQFAVTVGEQRRSGVLLPPAPLPLAPPPPAASPALLENSDSLLMPPPSKRPRVFGAPTAVSQQSDVQPQNRVDAAMKPAVQPASEQARPEPCCQECEVALASIHCSDCDVSYCAACDAEVHSTAAIGNHDGHRVALSPTLPIPV